MKFHFLWPQIIQSNSTNTTPYPAPRPFSLLRWLLTMGISTWSGKDKSTFGYSALSRGKKPLSWQKRTAYLDWMTYSDCSFITVKGYSMFLSRHVYQTTLFTPWSLCNCLLVAVFSTKHRAMVIQAFAEKASERMNNELLMVDICL